MISNIVRLQDEAQHSKPKIAEVADVVARYFVGVILIISAGTWFYWHQTKPDDAFGLCFRFSSLHALVHYPLLHRPH